MGTVYEIKNRDFSVITEIKFSKKKRDIPRFTEKKKQKIPRISKKNSSFIALETRILNNFNWF